MAKRPLESNGCPERSKKNNHKSIVLRWQIDESIENLRKFMDGQKIIADSWTTSRRSTSATAQPGTSGTGTKTSSSWYPVLMIGKLDRCEREKTLCPPRKLSQIFDENKDDRIPKNDRARQRRFDEALRADLEWHSPDWKLNRRKLPHHHLHNNGGNTNTKTLDGEIQIGGKSGGCRLFQSHMGLFSQISRADISECRARDGG